MLMLFVMARLRVLTLARHLFCLAGVHVNIPKYILQGSQTAPYAQSVTCGGSITTPAATPAPPAGCAAAGCDYTLAANSNTVNWGFYSSQVAPALTVLSGKTVSVEMLSHHAGDFYTGMIKGDAGIESIYAWGINGVGTPPGMTAAADMRGASGGGDGVHILTGPISVSDANGPALAGDVIKVDILSLKPRLNPAGKSYGINAAAWWGYHYGVNGPLARHWSGSTTVFPGKSQTGYITGDPDREMTNVYEIVMDSNGNPLYAEPAFRFVYGLNTTVPCIAPGSTPTGFSPGASVPCTSGKQTFPMYHYPGVITAHPTGNEDYTVAKKWQIPVNFHIGSLGLAPASPAYINSIPPNPYGGNMDDRRLGAGASIYLKVQTTGGLLSMGDAHGAQGDSELDGTGIEMHVNGQFRITLIRAGTGSATVPAAVLSSLNFPLIENANEFVVHSFTDPDWVTAKNLSVTACNGVAYASLGGTTTYNPMGCQNDAYVRAGTPCGAQGEVFCTSSTDDAVANTYHAARKFVSAMTGLSESNAISLLTVGCDLGITQVVDGNYGAWPVRLAVAARLRVLTSAHYSSYRRRALRDPQVYAERHADHGVQARHRLQDFHADGVSPGIPVELYVLLSLLSVFLSAPFRIALDVYYELWHSTRVS
jgi:acetamidase/formamidase